MKTRLLGLALLVFVADRLTKVLVESKLAVGNSIELLGDALRLTHVRNEGVVFGLWSSAGQWPLVAVSVLVLGLLIAYFIVTPPDKRLLLWSLALILGGALGNLYDRVVQGYVTDFVDVDVIVMRWPAFNLADTAICIGVGLMAIDVLRPEREAATGSERRA